MNKVRIAGLLGAIGVITGAFGAHALKARLAAESLNSYKTGVLYLLLHALALLMISLYLSKHTSDVLKLSYNLILAGVVLFSGSIFLLSTQSLTGVSMSFLGPITPIGGLLMIIGWINIVRFK